MTDRQKSSKSDSSDPQKPEPEIGGDPQDTGQEGKKRKDIVAPDPEKVKEAEKKKNAPDRDRST